MRRSNIDNTLGYNMFTIGKCRCGKDAKHLLKTRYWFRSTVYSQLCDECFEKWYKGELYI